ncbi:hemolysin D [Marinococcus halophilus]|uniref:Hemolysin III family protein n=1 Tax=Marinococcus halophilus TaxID=1371 RepID=A0A510Y4X2_MARHA|nr:hemolysin III family protein [Marinococcus halophilus]OZT80330.1 hemolysin D [Marinococcus halophilus]GEK58388.1 hemolysin III family protein [Marinococcus halophilus]
MQDQTHTFTKREEFANALTHGIGAMLSVAALVVMIVFASMNASSLHVVSVSIFGTSMLLSYVCSTLLHSFPAGKLKDLFEVFDHSAIYIFIAGTYTPFLFHALEGILSWTLFGIVWGIAFVGILFKAFFSKRFRILSTLFYIGMGWIIIIAWPALVSALPPGGLVLLVTGGILYTAGTVFYMWRSFPFHHAVWHFFVLAGSTAHFAAVFFYIIPL